MSPKPIALYEELRTSISTDMVSRFGGCFTNYSSKKLGGRCIGLDDIPEDRLVEDTISLKVEHGFSALFYCNAAVPSGAIVTFAVKARGGCAASSGS
jgi:hypothetical protein